MPATSAREKKRRKTLESEESEPDQVAEKDAAAPAKAKKMTKKQLAAEAKKEKKRLAAESKKAKLARRASFHEQQQIEKSIDYKPLLNLVWPMPPELLELEKVLFYPGIVAEDILKKAAKIRAFKTVSVPVKKKNELKPIIELPLFKTCTTMALFDADFNPVVPKDEPAAGGKVKAGGKNGSKKKDGEAEPWVFAPLPRDPKTGLIRYSDFDMADEIDNSSPKMLSNLLNRVQGLEINDDVTCIKDLKPHIAVDEEFQWKMPASLKVTCRKDPMAPSRVVLNIDASFSNPCKRLQNIHQWKPLSAEDVARRTEAAMGRWCNFLEYQLLREGKRVADKEKMDFGITESKFNITNKGIGDAAMMILVGFFSRFQIKIKTLWLGGNDLTDASIVKLAEYFATNQASHRETQIDLGSNGPFTEDGLRSLLTSLYDFVF